MTNQSFIVAIYSNKIVKYFIKQSACALPTYSYDIINYG